MSNEIRNTSLNGMTGEGWIKSQLWRLMRNAFSYDAGPLQGAPNIGLPSPMELTVVHDDFTEGISDGKWQTTEDAGATGPDADLGLAGGVVSFFCDGDDNDECYKYSTKCFKFALGKPMWFEARFRVDEAATDDANVIVGLSSAWGENMLLDNGGGPAANYSGITFSKVDGGTKIILETSVGTSQNTSASWATWADDTFFRVGFYFDGTANADNVTPYLNGVAQTPTQIELTSQLACGVGFGIKAGGANEESIEIDYITCIQVR